MPVHSDWQFQKPARTLGGAGNQSHGWLGTDKLQNQIICACVVRDCKIRKGHPTHAQFQVKLVKFNPSIV